MVIIDLNSFEEVEPTAIVGAGPDEDELPEFDEDTDVSDDDSFDDFEWDDEDFHGDRDDSTDGFEDDYEDFSDDDQSEDEFKPGV